MHNRQGSTLLYTLFGGLLIFNDLPPDMVWPGVDDWYIEDGVHHPEYQEPGPSPRPDEEFERLHNSPDSRNFYDNEDTDEEDYYEDHD